MSELVPRAVAEDQRPPPAPGRLHRLARRALRCGVDAGILGHRLRAHVVICGFPRSGSTLLQLMVDTCVAHVCSFRTEVDGLWAAREAPRRQPWLVTKLPSDVARVPQLRDWYARHPGTLRVVVTERDPRAVLTSRHAGYPPSAGYYVSPARWRRVHELVEALRGDPDVTVVRYEDLVRDPAGVQAALGASVGWTAHTPFADYHRLLAERDLDRMTRGALGGLRPVASGPTATWQRPEHRERLQEVLAALPELPRVLVEQGWAPDDAWVAAP